MDKKNYKDMWVYIEHSGGEVHPVSLELCCEARKLCDAAGEKLVAVVVGSLPEAELAKIRACGVDAILTVSGTGYEYPNVDAWAALFTKLCEERRPSAVLVGGTIFGRDFAPRLSARIQNGLSDLDSPSFCNPKTTR